MLNEIQDPADSDDEREPKTKFTPGSEADFELLYQTSYGKILGTLTAMLGVRARVQEVELVEADRARRGLGPPHRDQCRRLTSTEDAAPRGGRGDPAYRASRARPGSAGPHRVARSRRRARQAAAQAGGGDRAPPLPRLHQPGDRPVAGYTRAHGRLTTGYGQGPRAGDAEVLVRRTGRGHGHRRGGGC